jgi:hypothetical protein
MMRYGKGMDTYGRESTGQDPKGYDGFLHGPSQASGSQQATTGAGPTGKRGSKACVACE